MKWRATTFKSPEPPWAPLPMPSWLRQKLKKGEAEMALPVMKPRKVCGTCRYRRPNVDELELCCCPDSDHYDHLVTKDDYCEDWEGRDAGAAATHR